MEIAKFIVEVLMVIFTALAIFTALFKERLNSRIKSQSIIGTGYDKKENLKIFGIRYHIGNVSCYPIEVLSIKMQIKLKKSKEASQIVRNMKYAEIFVHDVIEPFRSIDYVLNCDEINNMLHCEGLNRKSKLIFKIGTATKLFKLKSAYTVGDILACVKKEEGAFLHFNFSFKKEDVKSFYSH